VGAKEDDIDTALRRMEETRQVEQSCKKELAFALGIMRDTRRK
jgi:hypothetical protein